MQDTFRNLTHAVTKSPGSRSARARAQQVRRSEDEVCSTEGNEGKQGSTVQDIKIGENPSELSTGRLLLIGGPAYGVFIVGLWTSYELGSVPGIIAVTLLATALAALMYGGFSIITAEGVGITFKARRGKKRSKKQKAKSPRRQHVEALNSTAT